MILINKLYQQLIRVANEVILELKYDNVLICSHSNEINSIYIYNIDTQRFEHNGFADPGFGGKDLFSFYLQRTTETNFQRKKFDSIFIEFQYAALNDAERHDPQLKWDKASNFITRVIEKLIECEGFAMPQPLQKEYFDQSNPQQYAIVKAVTTLNK